MPSPDGRVRARNKNIELRGLQKDTFETLVAWSSPPDLSNTSRLWGRLSGGSTSLLSKSCEVLLACL